MDLSKDISAAVFNKFPVREIYQIVFSSGRRETFLTKPTAYGVMEQIHKSATSMSFDNKKVVSCSLNDLDGRPERLVFDNGDVFELITVDIKY